MGFRKQLLKKLRRRRSKHVIKFEKDSISKKFEEFINVTSNLYDESIVLKKKYALHYFQNEDYETPLYYNCLQVSEKYRIDKNTVDLEGLSFFKATLSDFVNAFELVLVDDFHRSIHSQIITTKRFKAQLQTLMKLVPDSVTAAPENFSKEKIENVTKEYISGLEGELVQVVCPGLTRPKCEKRLTGFAVTKQFCSFLYFFITYLQNLLPKLPH